MLNFFAGGPWIETKDVVIAILVVAGIGAAVFTWGHYFSKLQKQYKGTSKHTYVVLGFISIPIVLIWLLNVLPVESIFDSFLKFFIWYD